MNQKNITNIDSILETKASGCISIEMDLSMPDGKSIAELLNEQKEEEEETT